VVTSALDVDAFHRALCQCHSQGVALGIGEKHLVGYARLTETVFIDLIFECPCLRLPDQGGVGGVISGAGDVPATVVLSVA
jgi:hypothetical protein